MTAQTASLQSGFPAPGLVSRYQSLWQAIEEAIEESVLILLGKRPGEADQAGRKIRALESASRTLARSQNMRAQMRDEEPRMTAGPRCSDETGPVPEFVVPAFADKPAPSSEASPIPDPSTSHTTILDPQMAPPPAPEPASATPAAMSSIRNPQPILRRLTKMQGSTSRSCLADLLLPENPLPEDPRNLQQQHQTARRSLGPAFDEIAQNAKKSLQATECRSSGHRQSIRFMHRP